MAIFPTGVSGYALTDGTTATSGNTLSVTIVQDWGQVLVGSPSNAWTFQQTAGTTITIPAYFNDTTGFVFQNNTRGPITAGGPAAGSHEPFSPLVIKRAERLLRSRLTSQQLRCWLRNKHFFVPSPTDPSILYRVQEYGMIRVYQDGLSVRDLCIHGCEALPNADKLVGLKLLIEHEEPDLLKTANVHRLPVDVVKVMPRRLARAA